MRFTVAALTAIVAVPSAPSARSAAPPPGYFRYPALHGDVLIFSAEGDLWRVAATGGPAQRITTHPAEETHPAISPDGKTLAYSAAYEGPTEVYTMPVEGGTPVRRTWEGGNAQVVGWTPDGRILYATTHYSTLPSTQLVAFDLRTNRGTLYPLSQASDGTFLSDGSLIFTRLPFQGSFTKRYHGGTAQNLWRYSPSAPEAVPLTGDYAGTSKTPMFWQGRIYFVSDRDGVMNIWSMRPDGSDLRQQTHHKEFDVQSPSLDGGRIAYQDGADLWIYDIARDHDAMVPITLVSDFDQTRERWIKAPTEWISTAHLSPNGDRIVFTARGEVFVVPVREGRLVDATPGKRIRYRDAAFMPDGSSLLTLSDQSGEFEFWNTPANGVGPSTQLTHDATVLRWGGEPSPDGRYVAHYDKNLELWLYDVTRKSDTRIAVGRVGDFGDLTWSPDSKWLAYTAPDVDQLSRIYLYSVAGNAITPVTSDRYDSSEPTWSPDGKWLYFLSERHFASEVGSPWGSRAPQPFFDDQTMIYQIPLVPGTRSPFRPDDELEPAHRPPRDTVKANAADTTHAAVLTVDLNDIVNRLEPLPVSPGNYSGLASDGRRLYVVTRAGSPARRTLITIAIDNKRQHPDTFATGVGQWELSRDRQKVMFRKGNDWYVADAGAKAPADLHEAHVDLSGWSFDFNPVDEWHQEFVDAWRLERDYFYNRTMNGVDWAAMRRRYEPLVDRVTEREELSDILSQMMGELTTLHTFVYGGDLRKGDDNIVPASLGAVLARDADSGFRVDHIYRSDPNDAGVRAPLVAPGVDVREGDVIESVNGIPARSVSDPGALLRDQAGHQVLLAVRTGNGAPRDVVATPITQAQESDLRYSEWEYTRRLHVDSASDNSIGYVHLRAMGTPDINQWERDFFPVFNRAGLIIDVRHNRGGNIDSWILGQLLRQVWAFWQSRVGAPYSNMQFAFRGHMVVLTDQYTASDGEAFTEGFKRLKLGKVVGVRTWGGEIWLSSSNTMVDGGIATAAEDAMYGPERRWIIEGHGVDPDTVVDNLPHATFAGRDAQLDAAVALLKQEIHDQPVTVPAAPAYPDRWAPQKP